MLILRFYSGVKTKASPRNCFFIIKQKAIGFENKAEFPKMMFIYKIQMQIFYVFPLNLRILGEN